MKVLNFADVTALPVSHNEKIQKQVVLGYHEIGNISTLARSVFPPGEIVGEHNHTDLDEVFIVQSGEGQIEIAGQSFKLEPGTCAVVEAGEMHCLKNTGKIELVLQYFGITH